MASTVHQGKWKVLLSAKDTHYSRHNSHSQSPVWFSWRLLWLGSESGQQFEHCGLFTESNKFTVWSDGGSFLRLRRSQTHMRISVCGVEGVCPVWLWVRSGSFSTDRSSELSADYPPPHAVVCLVHAKTEPRWACGCKHRSADLRYRSVPEHEYRRRQ